MQPSKVPATPCPHCGMPTVPELLTGSPLNSTPTFAPPRQVLYSWHVCKGRMTPKHRAAEASDAAREAFENAVPS